MGDVGAESESLDTAPPISALVCTVMDMLRPLVGCAFSGLQGPCGAALGLDGAAMGEGMELELLACPLPSVCDSTREVRGLRAAACDRGFSSWVLAVNCCIVLCAWPALGAAGVSSRTAVPVAPPPLIA